MSRDPVSPVMAPCIYKLHCRRFGDP